MFLTVQPSSHLQALFYITKRLPSSYTGHTNEDPKQKQVARINNKINYVIRIRITECLRFTETTFISAPYFFYQLLYFEFL